MTRAALCLRGNGALRVRVLPADAEAGAGADTRVSGTGADKQVTQQVDAVQLEHACAAVLSAVKLGAAVCEADALQKLDKTAVEGTPLQRACLWRAALEVLLASGHVVRSGLWYLAASTCCVPMDCVTPGGDQAASVAVAVSLRGRLVQLRRPQGVTREGRRQRGMGRLRKPQRPRVKPERRVQSGAPKGRDKAGKKSTKRVAFAEDA